MLRGPGADEDQVIVARILANACVGLLDPFGRSLQQLKEAPLARSRKPVTSSKRLFWIDLAMIDWSVSPKSRWAPTNRLA